MNGKKDAINEFEVINTFGAHYFDWKSLIRFLCSAFIGALTHHHFNIFCQVDDVFSFSRGSDDQMQTEELDSTG